MATRFYGPGLKKLLDGTKVIGTATFKIMLLNDSYVFNADHEFVSSVNSNEISGATGYTGGYNGSGRKTVNLTVDYDTATDKVRLTFDDQQWTTFLGTGNVGAAVIISEQTNDAGSHLIAHVDFAADKPANVDTFTVDAPTLAAGGTLQLAV